MSKFHGSILLAAIAAIIAIATLHGAMLATALAVIVLAWMTAFGVGAGILDLQYFAPVTIRGRSDRNAIALTFDDGPDPETTPALLELLAREKIHATFFCIGQKVVAYPELARRIVAEGHEIENHSHHHNPYRIMFNRGRAQTREFELAQHAIESATGVRPRYVRPPVGMTNPHFNRMMKDLSVTLVGWDVRPLDTARPTQQVIDYVLQHAKPGSIVLLHDGGAKVEHITRIVDEVVKALRAKGHLFDRVDNMIE